MTVDLGAGRDSLTLADGANFVTVSNVETVTGGTGDDTVTLGTVQTSGTIDLGDGTNVLHLANGANTLTVTNVETLTGGSGNDNITFGGAASAPPSISAAASTFFISSRHQRRYGDECRDPGRRQRRRHLYPRRGRFGHDHRSRRRQRQPDAADGANFLTVSNVETIVGGSGNTGITLARRPRVRRSRSAPAPIR